MANNSNETLILEVQTYPQLYDPSCEAYKDSVKKQDIWEAIGVRMDLPGTQAAKKWKYIRDAFVKSRTKQKTKSGQAAKVVKPYKYSHILEFLLPYIQPRSSQSNLEDEYTEDEKFPPVLLYSDEDGLATQANGTVSVISKKRKRKSDPDNALEESILAYIREGRNSQREEDEDDMFFTSMAASVKRLPLEVKSCVKFNIHQLIFEAEQQSK